MPKLNRELLHRHGSTFAFLLLLAGGVILYAQGASTNPPGFFIDESSIAYNAHLIAQTGQDEFGKSWPLYFRAFTDYKNPVHIYLLAAVFRLTGPSIAVARSLSAAAGVLTALILGLLGMRLASTQRAGRNVGLIVMTTALLTPWLFELSRVVMEVALYPLALALFLLCVRRASEKLTWGASDIIALAATLALLTYTYSIGRLLGPLLALGLVFFVRRARVWSVILAWCAYALTLVPLFVFQIHNPGALMGRFHVISYLGPQNTAAEISWGFIKHYLGNINPWRFFINEHSNVSEIIHIPGAQPLLFATAVFAVAGAMLLLRRRRLDAWWSFVIYGLAVSIVPASLTNESFHMLRLAAVPVCLIVLTIPALTWIVEKSTPALRIVFAAVLVVTLAQGLIFQYQYRTGARTPRRLHLFDADYPTKILPMALAAASEPIYIADAPAVPGYIQAYWFGTLQKIPLERFVILSPEKPAPESAVVITTDIIGPRWRILTASEPYTVCTTQGSPRPLAPLPNSGFRAEITVLGALSRMRRGESTTIKVELKNTSDVVWLARERSLSPFQLSVANHWLDPEGAIIVHDDGRGALPRDLRPGETVEVSLTINAPPRSGDYQLELDVLQEGVSWFGLRGSRTQRIHITVVED